MPRRGSAKARREAGEDVPKLIMRVLDRLVNGKNGDGKGKWKVFGGSFGLAVVAAFTVISNGNSTEALSNSRTAKAQSAIALQRSTTALQVTEQNGDAREFIIKTVERGVRRGKTKTVIAVLKVMCEQGIEEVC